jgi:hypothetical protein
MNVWYHCMNVIWNACIEKDKINKKCGNRHQTFRIRTKMSQIHNTGSPIVTVVFTKVNHFLRASKARLTPKLVSCAPTSKVTLTFLRKSLELDELRI